MNERARKDPQEEGQRKLLDKIAELSQQLEKFNIAEYLEQLNNPRRYLMVNFMGGLFRGFGIALGMTILGAFVLFILQRLVVLNLPLIGDFIAELVRIVLTYL
ncbi:MAG TPA: hypothetical protein DCD97_07285 [Firmicutes bacterium]|jgi:hypothetical protein|nr:hypothetical protein [Bacillota bacterium]